MPHAITPVQQFAYTKGKDATDMILIIDAMDLLYSGALDGFCIVSSDSDFTPLASRIRESGLTVYGFGRSKTPEAFIRACDKFIYVENLIEEQERVAGNIGTNFETPDLNIKQNNKQNEFQKEDAVSIETIINPDEKRSASAIDKATLNLIYKAVKDNTEDNGWANLSIVGQYITAVKPDFDSRNYGRAKLSGLIKMLNLFETKIEDSQMYLRKRSFSTFVKYVQKAINQHSDKNGWACIQDIVVFLKKSDFNIENYQDTIKSIHSGWLEFSENGQMVKIAKLML